MAEQEVSTVEEIAKDFRSVLFDVYVVKRLYDRWHNDNAFVDPAVHMDYTVTSSVPSAGDLNEGEVQFGDATGPNGRDELFWSVDGKTVARVEADSVIS